MAAFFAYIDIYIENKQINTYLNMNKLIRLTEGDLHKIVKESVKRALKEDQMEQYYRQVMLNVAQDMTAGEVLCKLGNAIGWEKLYGYVRTAFNGDNDSYTRSQEMRGPFGSM